MECGCVTKRKRSRSEVPFISGEKAKKHRQGGGPKKSLMTGGDLKELMPT